MLQTHHRTHLGPVWFIKFYSTSLRLWVVAKQILNLIWKTTTASKTREKCKHIVFRMQFQTDACVLCVPMMHSANAFIIQQRLKYTSFLVDFRWVLTQIVAQPLTCIEYFIFTICSPMMLFTWSDFGIDKRLSSNFRFVAKTKLVSSIDLISLQCDYSLCVFFRIVSQENLFNFN